MTDTKLDGLIAAREIALGAIRNGCPDLIIERIDAAIAAERKSAESGKGAFEEGIEAAAQRAEQTFKPSNVLSDAGIAANNRHKLALAIAKSIRALRPAPSVSGKE